jgi:hypothetical protein
MRAPHGKTVPVSNVKACLDKPEKGVLFLVYIFARYKIFLTGKPST